jgi:hypothetical protein
MDFDKKQFQEWLSAYTNFEALQLEARDIFSGWSLRDPTNTFVKTRQVLGFLEKIVVLMERFSKDAAFLSGKDKNKAAVEFIDDLIKLPFFFEWADQIVIENLLTSIIYFYNGAYGHNWLEVKEKTIK